MQVGISCPFEHDPLQTFTPYIAKRRCPYWSMPDRTSQTAAGSLIEFSLVIAAPNAYLFARSRVGGGKETR